MRRSFVVLSCLAVFIQASPESQSRVRLLRPGTFLMEPPRVLPTEQWFGLRRAGDKWDLVRVAPKIAPARAVCGDRATQISVDGVEDVLILLTGVRNLSEGPVGAAIHRPRLLHPGEALDIGAGYSLEASGRAVREVGGTVFVNYALWTRHGREAQRIASFERNSLDNPRQIVWAGDIDRDARPDLLFDFPLGDVGHNYVLFLSSTRGGDRLVSEAAAFSTPGC